VRNERWRKFSRDRFLSGEELGWFFEALDLTENPAFKDFIRLSLFTGARKSNVLSMRWKDIDFERNVWKIPGELSKNGEPMQIPWVRTFWTFSGEGVLKPQASSFFRAREPRATTRRQLKPGKRC
jgi:integrase